MTERRSLSAVVLENFAACRELVARASNRRTRAHLLVAMDEVLRAAVPPGAPAERASARQHTCHDMNPPFPYECAACVEERIDAALERGAEHLPASLSPSPGPPHEPEEKDFGLPVGQGVTSGNGPPEPHQPATSSAPVTEGQ